MSTDRPQPLPDDAVEIVAQFIDPDVWGKWVSAIASLQISRQVAARMKARTILAALDAAGMLKKP